MRVSHLDAGRAAFAEAVSVSSGDFLALFWWYSMPLLSPTLLMHYNILISSDYTQNLCQFLRKIIYKKYPQSTSVVTRESSYAPFPLSLLLS